MAGFHHISSMMTRDAEVRFSPTEPDLRETRRTGMGVVRKAVNIASRASFRILPSSMVRNGEGGGVGGGWGGRALNFAAGGFFRFFRWFRARKGGGGGGGGGEVQRP